MDWSAHQLSSGMSEFRGTQLTFCVRVSRENHASKAGVFVCSLGAAKGLMLSAWPGPGRQVFPSFPGSLTLGGCPVCVGSAGPHCGWGGGRTSEGSEL